jgi:hypothetical protein
MPVCPSTWKKKAPIGRIFMKPHTFFLFFGFLKPVEKIQVSLESGKNNGYCTWRSMHNYNIFLINSYFKQNL